MIPDESQLTALQSWYKPEHPLYKDARHPLIKLAGEAGELLDLYGKEEYKSNFSWWRCKVCGFMPAEKKQSETDYFAYTCMSGNVHTPLILDELGDYSYYLRILCWQNEVSFEAICKENIPEIWNVGSSIFSWLTWLTRESVNMLFIYMTTSLLPREDNLAFLTKIYLAVLSKLDIQLEQVLELNYKKLNSEPTKHGWQDA
jgi:NTP pyrophosphatase (non-canonical NTP hydrolase)